MHRVWNLARLSLLAIVTTVILSAAHSLYRVSDMRLSKLLVASSRKTSRGRKQKTMKKLSNCCCPTVRLVDACPHFDSRFTFNEYFSQYWITLPLTRQFSVISCWWTRKKHLVSGVKWAGCKYVLVEKSFVALSCSTLSWPGDCHSSLGDI